MLVLMYGSSGLAGWFSGPMSCWCRNVVWYDFWGMGTGRARGRVVSSWSRGRGPIRRWTGGSRNILWGFSCVCLSWFRSSVLSGRGFRLGNSPKTEIGSAVKDSKLGNLILESFGILWIVFISSKWGYFLSLCGAPVLCSKVSSFVFMWRPNSSANVSSSLLSSDLKVVNRCFSPLPPCILASLLCVV